ncbi:MFS transporter [Salinigranum rubrum]|uniref:MFS transporter n=1 Tax=Salinigranum rubrum TaxID=755307 RepID=UPI0013A5B404|nr:MFS transporter [Salinigranum rubrum]
MFERLAGDDASVLGDRGFQVVLLASVASPLGASVVSPILDSLTGPLGVSEAQVGLLMAVFTAPGVVLIPVAGVVSDRYGRKPVLATGLALFGLAGVAISLTTDFTTTLALRLLQGVGYAGIAPVLIASVGDLYRGAREATAQGLRFTTVGASLTVFPLLSGLLVGVAWQAPFLLYAVALVASLVVVVAFDEPTREPRTDGGAVGWNLGALAGLARQPHIAATLVGRAVPSFLWFVFLTHNSLLVVRVLGGTAAQAGGVVALASVASSLGGHRSDGSPLASIRDDCRCSARWRHSLAASPSSASRRRLSPWARRASSPARGSASSSRCIGAPSVPSRPTTSAVVSSALASRSDDSGARPHRSRWVSRSQRRGPTSGSRAPSGCRRSARSSP